MRNDKHTPAKEENVSPERYHVPGQFLPKLVFLLSGITVFLFGASFFVQPLGRMLFGASAEASVAKIVRVEPGASSQTIRHRKTFDPETDYAVTFQHWVSISENGRQRSYRLGVDSRRTPYLSVNDRVEIAYYPNDSAEEPIAYVAKHARTWGIGLLYVTLGVSFIIGGIPMLLAVGKPIRIDPEAPSAKNSGRDGSSEPETETKALK